MEWTDYFYYDESSPSRLRWKVDRYRGKNLSIKFISAGDSAGCLSKGYYKVELKGRSYLCHRIIYELHNGLIPDGKYVDHLDQNKSNNNIANLRLVSRVENARNCRKSSNNTSGVTGVRHHKCGRGGEFWRVKWRTLDGKDAEKYFSISKLGYDAAFEQAVLFRTEMLEQLNRAGGGYTEQHGT